MSFYGWLWRSLPGPITVKILLVAVVVLAVVAVLFTEVFPAIAPLVPFNENTVG